MRDQKRACAASREQYMKVKASCHSEAARVRQNRVVETGDTRRASTLMPKPSISTAVKSVGTAYAEKPYAAASIMAIWVYVRSLSGARHCEGHKRKSRMSGR